MMHLLMTLIAGGTATSAPVAEIGVTAAAPALIQGVVESYDVGGFRLGMSEDEVSVIAKQRNYAPRDIVRVENFEDEVRSSVPLPHGVQREPLTGKSELSTISFKAADGGGYVLRFLIWPDGAHVSDVVYITPAGTSLDAWREMLTAKYGPADRTESSRNVDVKWCTGHRAGCERLQKPIWLRAMIGPTGGTIELASADQTAPRLWNLKDREVQRRAPHVRPGF